MTDHDTNIFLAELAQSGNVSASARRAGIARGRLYKLKASDKKFAEAWAMAIEEAADLLASEAMRRAIEGFEEVKYFKGEPVGTVRKYSDQLLMFLLKAYRPGMFSQHADNAATTSMEKNTHHHATSSLLKKMETLIKEDDTDGTSPPD